MFRHLLYNNNYDIIKTGVLNLQGCKNGNNLS